MLLNGGSFGGSASAKQPKVSFGLHFRYIYARQATYARWRIQLCTRLVTTVEANTELIRLLPYIRIMASPVFMMPQNALICTATNMFGKESNMLKQYCIRMPIHICLIFIGAVFLEWDERIATIYPLLIYTVIFVSVTYWVFGKKRIINILDAAWWILLLFAVYVEYIIVE